MAWQFESAGAIALGSSMGSMNVAYPSGVSAGDLLLIYGWSSNSTTSLLDPPSGFTFLGGSGSYPVAIHGRIADGTESGTVAFTPSVTASGRFYAAMSRFSGAPADIAGIVIESRNINSSSSINLPIQSLDAVESAGIDGALLFAFGGKYGQMWEIVDPPSGMTMIHSDFIHEGTLSVFGAAYAVQLTAANRAVSAFTLDNALEGSHRSMIIALAPGDTGPAAGFLELPPLYYGATLLSNRSNIQYKVSEGHADLVGEVIVSGTNGATNGSGVFSLASSLGDVDAPVTVKLWWQEGSDPTLTHSVVHKTTLVAES